MKMLFVNKSHKERSHCLQSQFSIAITALYCW